MRKALIEVLADLQSPLDRTPAEAAVVAAFLEAAADLQNEVAWRGFEGLGKSHAPTLAVRQALVRTLSDPRADSLVVGAAVEAAARLFPKDAAMAALVATWLERRDQVSANDIDEALTRFGAIAVKPIVRIVSHSRVAEAKTAGARLLGLIKSQDPSVVPALKAMLALSDDGQQSQAAASALAELAPQALDVVPDLLASARKSEGDARKDYLTALGSLASFALAHPEESRSFVRRWRDPWREAAALAKAEAGDNGFPHPGSPASDSPGRCDSHLSCTVNENPCRGTCHNFTAMQQSSIITFISV